MLNKGDVLQIGQNVTSTNGRYRAIMQPNGNFELMAGDEKALWETYTSGKGQVTSFGRDGNFVVFSENNQMAWTSNTADQADYLVCQNDGNLAIYNSQNLLRWSSNSLQSKPVCLCVWLLNRSTFFPKLMFFSYFREYTQ